MNNISAETHSVDSNPRLDVFDHFPGFTKAVAFLQDQILRGEMKTVADLGGGAKPLLGGEFIKEQHIDYTVFDIDQDELDKAPDCCIKVCVDACAPIEIFSQAVGTNRYDLIFSHMFLEHVKDPVAVHRNICAALKPGGLAIHMFPAPYNLPLATNRIVPEWLSRKMLKIAHPDRYVGDKHLKFPAFYKMCEPPSPAMHKEFDRLGFEVVRYTGFIGHRYYRRFPVLRDAERASRQLLVNLNIPMITYLLLILRKKA
jgi:SAM-dependent methyltransferase